MKHIFLPVAVLALLLVGAGCASATVERPTPAPVVETQGTKAYTNTDADLTFDYPASWGDVRVSRELPGIDTGKRLSLGFTDDDRVFITVASAEYSQGVGEGAPTYFTLRKESSDIGSVDAAKEAIVQGFDILSVEKRGPGVYRMLHNHAGYGWTWARVDYLFPTWDRAEFATLMVHTLPGPRKEYDTGARGFTKTEAEDALAGPEHASFLSDVEALVMSIR